MTDENQKSINKNDIISNTINNTKNGNKPFIKDVTFYKSRYQKQQKEAKTQLKSFKQSLDRLEKLSNTPKMGAGDLEEGGNSEFSGKNLARQMLVDTKNIGKLIEECAEIMNELAKEDIDRTVKLKFKS